MKWLLCSNLCTMQPQFGLCTLYFFTCSAHAVCKHYMVQSHLDNTTSPPPAYCCLTTVATWEQLLYAVCSDASVTCSSSPLLNFLNTQKMPIAEDRHNYMSMLMAPGPGPLFVNRPEKNTFVVLHHFLAWFVNMCVDDKMAICKYFVETWIFSVWFQFGKFCYENYEYKEQTGLKLQLGSPLKFSFLYAFSLAAGSCGNTFLFEATFLCCRRPLCVYFSVMVSVGG